MQIVTGYRAEQHITSNDIQGENQGIFGTGSYVLNIGNKFAVTTVSANEYQISDGEAVHQGVHFRVDPNSYDTVTIDNGTQGMKRIDLIVARYTKDGETSVENVEWAVIKGTEAASSPATPAYTTGDILDGDYTVDMPMYKITLNGVNVQSVQAMFSTLVPMATLQSRLTTAESDIEDINEVTRYNGTLISNSWCDATSLARIFIVKCGKVGYLRFNFYPSAAITHETSTKYIASFSIPELYTEALEVVPGSTTSNTPLQVQLTADGRLGLYNPLTTDLPVTWYRAVIPLIFN